MRGSARRLILAAGLAVAVSPPVVAQHDAEQPVFRAGVDLVSVAAVVRDTRGRIVRSLSRDDFTVLDGGEARPIVEVGADTNAPVSIAILVDGSGSMRPGVPLAERIGDRLLAQLRPDWDQAALMSFDTRLLMLRDFTSDFADVRRGFREVDPFGATSVYDAIAGGSGKVAQRARSRRALLVVTDGSDNASTLAPDDVAWIASTIDVPVYVMAVNTGVKEGGRHPEARESQLADVARATGGEFFAAATETRQQIAIGRIVDELRHQYLIAFEPSSAPGLRPIEIRTTNTALKVRTRRWYSSAAGD